MQGKNPISDDKARAIQTLKTTLEKEKPKGLPVSLDDLIEVLDADDLRNVVGMVRPKGQPGAEMRK